MSDQPQGNTDVQVLRRMRKVNFTLYRKGATAFKLESRQQGHIRKVISATYNEEIMTNDAVSITLVSTERLDFKLRDYIVYYDRPYFLNRVPKPEVDDKKRYTYTMTFEGVMFELGRVAFILRNANGYDFYGTLPEFGELVVDNLNRINMWVEWTFGGQTYKAKYRNDVDMTYTYTPVDPSEEPITMVKKIYMWGLGFNNDLEGMGETFIYTDGIPSVGDHGVDPEYNPLVPDSEFIVQGISITRVCRWSLDFPEATDTPAIYPSPAQHIPDNEYSYEWESSLESVDDILEEETTIRTQRSKEEAQQGHVVYEYDRYTLYSLEDHFSGTLIYNQILQRYPERTTWVWYKPCPQPSHATPDSITEIEEHQQYGIFAVEYVRIKHLADNTELAISQPKHIIHGLDGSSFSRTVTYKAVPHYISEWGILPIVPQSGSPTGNYYPTESIFLSYDSHSCLAVIQDLVTKWDEWEWRISDNIDYGYINGEMLVCGKIVIRQRSNDVYDVLHVMGFGKSGGLEKIGLKYEDEGNIPSRVYFYGGTQNLPQYYRNTRLCLPNYTKENSYIDFSEVLDDEDYPIFQIGISNQTCEEVKLFDDIFPASEPFVIKDSWGVAMADNATTTIYGPSTRYYLQLTIPKADFFLITDVWKDWVPGQGNPDYEEWLVWRQLEDTEESRYRYIQYFATTGVSKYMSADTPYIVFQTGDLAGFKLSVHDCFYDKDVEHIVLQLNVTRPDNEEFKDGDDTTSPQTVQSDYVPNQSICCRSGDKFIVEGINMPVAYTYYQDGSESDYSAENALWKASMDYMTNKAESIGYELEVARDYVVRKELVFRCFDGIQFSDITTDNTIIRKRIRSIELDLLDGYKYNKIEVSNCKVKNAAALLGTIINQHVNKR